MKILVAEDNTAIQEILREIIVSTGNEAILASGVKDASDAVFEFNPDLIFIDMYLEGEPGLNVISTIHEEDVSYPMKVYMIKNSRDYVPKDNAFIVGEIEKPFESSEIVRIISEAEKIPEEVPAPVPEKRPIWKRKRTEKVQNVEPEPSELPAGKAYLFIGNGSDVAYAHAIEFLTAGYDLMVITGSKIKAVRDKMKSESVQVMALSSKSLLGYKDAKKLGTLTESVNAFIREKERPVILFDNLSVLIEKNGANRILTMLRQLTSDNAETATFIISAEEGSLGSREIEIMASNMTVRTQN